MEADTTVHTKNLTSTLIQLRYFKVVKTWCHESHYTHVIRLTIVVDRKSWDFSASEMKY